MTAAGPHLGPSGHGDTFSRDRLPPLEQWPDLSLEGLDYPDRLNAAVELTDRMVERGFGDSIALIGKRAPPHLQGALRLDQPARARPRRGFRPEVGGARADPFGQQPGHGRLLAGGDQGGRGRGQHDAAAARSGARADRGQMRAQPCALRHAPDGRARALRQGEPVPAPGGRLRRHRQHTMRSSTAPRSTSR